jgi:predicted HTH transcriptional regulator
MAGIEAMINERREETLHLEFKTLSSASVSNLAKDDRKVLAKAICGFANADGGTLIVGIKTARRMGGAKRYPSIAIHGSMGFAKGSTHPTSCVATPNYAQAILYALPFPWL